MKSLVDDLGKWITAVSFALLVVSIVHDWGYFSVLGLGFQSIQTPYDYLAHAVEWLPLNLIFLSWWPIILFLKKERPEYPSGIHEKKQRWMQIPVGIMLLLMVIWAVEAFWDSMDELSFRVGQTLLYVYLAIVIVWDNRLLSTPTRKFLFALPFPLLMAFFFGAADAREGLSSSENVYRIEPKSGDPFNVNLLRSVEKGLLVWDSAAHRVTLIRWDEVNRISHFGPVRDKVTVGCRFTKFMCPEPITP